MSRLRVAGVFLGLLALAPYWVSAYSSPGTTRGYVSDFAGVLSSSTVQTLERELADFEHTTSNEIVVVTVTDMGGDYVEHYAVKLFEEWKVGKRERDNGVLLLLAKSERKLRIEVGYGLEGALPDSLAKRILDNEMTPRLKAGDYDGAVTAAVTAIMQATKGEYVGSSSASHAGFLNMPSQGIAASLFFIFCVLQMLASMLARSKSWWAGGVLGVVGASFVAWQFTHSLLMTLTAGSVLGLIGAIFDYVVSKGYQSAKARGVTPPWWTGGAGGSGSGGGFGGFGGGSSGGGGASGGW